MKTYPLTLSEKTFWDINISEMDLEQNAESIIVRIFERGTMDEIVDAYLHYGKEKCVDILLDAPYLMEKTMYLSKAILDISDLNQYRCYTTKQYHPVS